MNAPPSDSPTINIVVVQPTPFCNINCSYCYLPQRADKTVMQHSTVRVLFEQLFASSWASQELTVIWHAGEPLVVPPAFYESAFQTIAALCPEFGATCNIRCRRTACCYPPNGVICSSDGTSESA